jgi:hypothetical protein
MIRAQGAPLPDRSDRRWERVVAVEQHKPLVAVVLNEDWFGLWVHWDALVGKRGQNVPCMGGEVCKLCLPPASLAPRWCGYIGVFVRDPDPRLRGVRVLALTEGMCRQLLPYCDHPSGLRGVEVKWVRSPEKRNGPVRIDKAVRIDAGPVAPAFDVIPSLCKFYGVRSLFQLDSFRNQVGEVQGVADATLP